MRIKKLIFHISAVVLLLSATGCEKTKSYSEMLKDEEQACNWYLAQNKIVVDIPKDSVFQTGQDAPFYKMNSEGTLYMKVITAGDRNKIPENGDRVYFSFMRQNIQSLMNGYINEDVWEGNAENMAFGSTSFLLGETTLTSSVKFGTGIQTPVTYLGYYSEVILVVKSLEGFTDDQTNCTPYVYKVRYFPALY